MVAAAAARFRLLIGKKKKTGARRQLVAFEIGRAGGASGWRLVPDTAAPPPAQERKPNRTSTAPRIYAYEDNPFAAREETAGLYARTWRPLLFRRSDAKQNKAQGHFALWGRKRA